MLDHFNEPKLQMESVQVGSLLCMKYYYTSDLNRRLVKSIFNIY